MGKSLIQKSLPGAGRRLRGFFLLVLALPGAFPAYAGDSRIDRPHEVKDPAYGEILFDYYQQRWFAAMSKTLVALETGALHSQRDRARVLLGATYVRYGMADEAEALFRDLLAESVDAELASRVWLHLAELYYRQGKYERVLSVLDERVPPVPEAILSPYHSLRVRTLMKLGRYEDTESILRHLDEDASLGAYLKYNLAVSRINAGRGAAGEPLLRDLVNLVPGDEEVNAVKDKSILALGLYYLRQGEMIKARGMLGNTRLEGPFSDTALLLHSRAWLESDQPGKAIAPLTTLSRRSVQHESVQAALLALPHLYVLRGNQAEAVKKYRAAIHAYNEHFTYIEQLRDRIMAGDWFDALVTEPAWSTAMEPLPPFQPNRIDSFATFAPLFATQAFHNTWRDYHETLRQLRLVAAWRQRMPALEKLLRAHERKHGQLVPAARTLLREVDAMDLDKRFDGLRERLQSAIDDNDWRQFATEEEKPLLEALDDATARAERWPEKMSPAIREKLEFYRGVLAWRIQEDIVPRQWRRIKALREMSELMDSHRDHVARVEHAMSSDDGRLWDYRREFEQLSGALSRLHERGKRLLARHRRHIESLALTRLAQTRERLVQFSALAWDNLGDIHNEAVRSRRQLPEPGERSVE